MFTAQKFDDLRGFLSVIHYSSNFRAVRVVSIHSPAQRTLLFLTHLSSNLIRSPSIVFAQRGKSNVIYLWSRLRGKQSRSLVYA